MANHILVRIPPTAVRSLIVLVFSLIYVKVDTTKGVLVLILDETSPVPHRYSCQKS